MSTESKTNWISIHLFYRHDLTILLVKLIIPLIEEWFREELIIGYFFVRYWGGGQHLRLRIKPTNYISNDEILRTINDKYEHALRGSKFEDPSYRIEFVEYIQELNRYGGPYSIGLAEKAFEDSSMMVLAILNQNSQNWDYSKAISIAMQVHVLFINSVTDSIPEAVQLLDFLLAIHIHDSLRKTQTMNLQRETEKTKNLFEKSYQEQRKSVDFLCREIWGRNGWEKNEWRQEWHSCAGKLIAEFNDLSSKEHLENPSWLELNEFPRQYQKNIQKWALLSSFFHMTNNRLGIHLRDEAFIYYALKNGMSELL